MAGEIEATTMGDRIARAGYKGRRLAEVINEALQAERERAAKIAETDDFTHTSGYRCHRGLVIAKKIREGKRDAERAAQGQPASRIDGGLVMAEKVKIEIIKGTYGDCLAVNDYRVAGPKVGVGGRVIQQWIADKEDVLDAFRTPDERHERLMASAINAREGTK